jgi:glutamate N-acetyltransferase/amino-acid N-acetyltransferase
MAEDLQAPRGFRFAAVEAGIRKQGGNDLALIVSDAPASAAGTFTSNRAVAAPVTLSRKNLRASRGRAWVIVANAGNANCATPNGMKVAEATAAAAAKLAAVKPTEVLVASTGVIGVPMDIETIPNALQVAFHQLDESRWSDAASAILTTDTRPKIARRQVGAAKVLGFAKGSGMIHPRMFGPSGSNGAHATPHATMLAFIVTDARIAPPALQKITDAAVSRTFNRISVDGDTSTNDTVFILANGAAGTVAEPRIARAIEEVMLDLAKAIAADGEGARRLVRIEVSGARNEAEADTVARAIGNSPLVKTAMSGGDPNWGRILSAAGASGAPIDPAKIAILLQGVPVCKRGGAVEFNESALGYALGASREVRVDMSLGRGKGKAVFWTCDLTEGYIRINASYRT